jgi:hypothetical protein
MLWHTAAKALYLTNITSNRKLEPGLVTQIDLKQPGVRGERATCNGANEWQL